MFRHDLPSRELHPLAPLKRLSPVDLPSANSMKCCSPPASLKANIMNFMEQANRKKTSSEVKNRWDAKTYKRYQISLRKDEDAEIIEFVESVKDCILPSEIFRIGAEQIKKGFLSQKRRM